MNQPFSVLRAAPKNLARLAELVDRVMRPYEVPGQGLRQRFPLVFSEDNAHNVYYIEDAGSPVSMAAAWKGQVVSGEAHVSVAAVGLVATLPEFQGRGMASQVLRQMWRDLRQDQVAVGLISGRRDLYFRLGTVVTGHFLRARGTPGLQSDRFTVQRVVVPQDVPALTNLYQAEPVRYVRSGLEMEKLVQGLRYPRRNTLHELFVAREADRIAAYCVLGVSDRWNGVRAMEWAGSRAAVLELLAWGIQHYQQTQADVVMQATDTTMQKLCEAQGMTVSSCPNLGSMGVLNEDALFEALELWRTEPKGQRKGPLVRNHSDSLEGRSAEMAQWVFSADGLGWSWPYAEELNYV